MIGVAGVRRGVAVLVVAVAAGGCAAQRQSSPEFIATLERLEAAAAKSELAAEQAAAAANRASESRAEDEPAVPSGPYHTALSQREHRNPAPQPVRSEREAAQIAVQFLRSQRVDWGKPSAITRSQLGYYIVEFLYRQTDRWDLDGVLLVHYDSGDVFLPLPR